jgi:hypothetical protein
MKKILLIGLLCMMLPSVSLAGPQWDISENSWMKLSFLGQVHYSFMDDAADESDFYLRRGRIILNGQLMDGVKMFVETDNDKHGMNGVEANTDIQDAFVDVQLGKANCWVKTGLILLPFSFESGSSAASLLGLDYNSEVVYLTNSFVWRDYGAEIHGGLGEKFAYRAGIFDGYKANEDADLRFTGHLAFNPIGKVNSDWFHAQNRLSMDNYLSIGAGYDTQNKATINKDTLVEDDSEAWVIDTQSGFDLAGYAGLTLNGAYYDWDSSIYKGNTMFVETGLLFMQKFQATVKCSQMEPDAGDDATDYTFGLHYFHIKHNLRGGIEYRTGDSSDWILAGIQFMI